MTSAAASSPGHVTLTDVLEAVSGAGEGRHVSVNDILQAIGPRGFGPLILVPALIIVTPASGIPGLSSLGGLTIALISIQYLFGRDHAWLPGFLRDRKIERSRLQTATGFLAKPARWIDKVLARRLPFLTARPLSYLLVGACVLIGAVMPLFELIPFSSSMLAGVVALFALALTTRDGVLALLAYGLLFAAGFGVAQIMGWI